MFKNWTFWTACEGGKKHMQCRQGSNWIHYCQGSNLKITALAVMDPITALAALHMFFAPLTRSPKSPIFEHVAKITVILRLQFNSYFD